MYKDKRVTNTARAVIILWNIGLFAAVWLKFYNGRTFQTYYVYGGIVSILIYCFIYAGLCNIYKGFRIASSSITEITLSQFFSFGIADLILYVESVLIRNRYITFLPGLTAVAAQLVGTAIITLCAKRYFMIHVKPQKTLLLMGTSVIMAEADRFVDRMLHKYPHLFDFRYMEYEMSNPTVINAAMDDCETVILYGLSAIQRRKFIERCIDEHKTFYFTPGVEDILMQGCSARHLLDTPLMKYDYTYEDERKLHAKRAFDLAFGIFFFVITCPVMALVALAIKLDDGGPVFFRQKRCTRDGKVFEILKFRSMIKDADRRGVMPTVSGDPRITRVGQFIRRYRLDELPQIINILRGDMSFVGPRPERVEHVSMYMRELPEFRYRMKVTAGLTGYAQIFGKYNTSAADKLKLDLLYIENQSMLLDLRLILLTAKIMFLGESTEGFEAERARIMNLIDLQLRQQAV